MQSDTRVLLLEGGSGTANAICGLVGNVDELVVLLVTSSRLLPITVMGLLLAAGTRQILFTIAHLPLSTVGRLIIRASFLVVMINRLGGLVRRVAVRTTL